MDRTHGLAIAFGVAFGLWVAADTYVGFYLGISLPVQIGVIATGFCLAGIVVIGLRSWRSALLALAGGAFFLVTLNRIWKYGIHPTDYFKLVANGLLMASPLIAGLGIFLFWRTLRRLGGAGAE